MAASEYGLCLPFSAVGAISGGASEELRNACANTLATLESLYGKSLRQEGVPAKASRELGSAIVSTIEGALLQARTRKSEIPMNSAATVLRGLIAFRVSSARANSGTRKLS